MCRTILHCFYKGCRSGSKRFGLIQIKKPLKIDLCFENLLISVMEAAENFLFSGPATEALSSLLALPLPPPPPS